MPLTSDDLRRYWANFDAANAALQADAEGWAEYQRARQSWDSALNHGRDRSGDPGAGDPGANPPRGGR